MTCIAKEIETLRQLALPDLMARYEALYGKPPRCRNREHMWKRCAWKLQEERFGGLSKVAKDRLDELIAEIDLPRTEQERTVAGVLGKPRRPDDPPVGTVLTRTWHGKEYQLTVQENGYELDGVLHKSLSEAARALTGSRWNGRLFWGITQRERSK